MKHFDFADIEQVNRIELKPGETVVFRTTRPLDAETMAGFHDHFRGTPLEGRALFLYGDDWRIATIHAEDED